MRCLLPLLALVLAACAPAPAAPSSLPSAPDPAAMAAVRVERVELPGFPEEHTPATLNRAVFLRYRAPGAVGARAVVVFVPGLFGGASGFDRLARGIVALEPGVEAWAVDRRANLLEDHAALREATDRNDPLVAWRHYVRDAGKPAGFSPVAGGEAPYAGYWGLETAIGDLRVVVTEARRVAPRVVLAGHSLGATLSAQYAGWDFAGRAGHEDLAGLVLLDGAPGAGGFASVSEASYRDGSGGPFGSRIAGVRDLEAGKASPFLAAPGFDAAGFARATAAAFLAARDPGGDSPGGVVPYPASNLAAAMLQVDDDYALVETFSATAGRADASVGPNLLALFTRGLGGLRVASVLGPAPG
ncbi:MAG TPA: hypothetical protein VNT60_09145, partial [Deinococcales bacterium]|nr:hypothetical protein [Deinococcales bacterium]